MKKIIRIETSHTKLLKIYYELSNVCNYKCWYCFPGSNDGSQPWPDAEKVKRSLEALVNHYNSSDLVDDIEIIFLGGEPTLWRHLSEVVEYLKTRCKVRLVMTTNGSRTLRWWREYGPYFDNINISVHHESADIDHIIEVARILHDKKVMFNTNVLMDNTNWDKCMSIYNKLMAATPKWPILVKPLHLDGVYNYTQEQTTFLKKQLKRWPALNRLWMYLTRLPKKKYKAVFSDGSSVTTDNPNYFGLHLYNRFQGWECNVGVNILFINYSGNVHSSCGQKLYNTDTVFNIYDDEFPEKFKPIIAPVICDMVVCGSCTGNTAVAKRKIF
jgi:MoaA/NifB/PqqE/SkfB family radical SAM enzyme